MDDTITFMDLIAVHTPPSEQEAQKLKRLIPAFNAGGGAAYGGHVYAQAVWAAPQTVGGGDDCSCSSAPLGLYFTRYDTRLFSWEIFHLLMVL
jgi:acyl-CoA thioesterase